MIIGLGRMGLAHAAVIQHIPGARIAALVDRDKGLGKMAASMGLRAPFYESPGAAIEREQPAVAYVCTPTYTHLPLVEELAHYGLDLFVEKPLGHSHDAAECMARAAEDKHLITAVGYNLSGEGTFVRARELLRSGVIGAPRRYEAGALHGEVFKAREGWLFDSARSGGGAAANIGTHILYYVSSCFGYPASLSAHCKRLFSARVEDEARVELKHAASGFGIEGTKLGTRNSELGTVEGSIHISWSVPNKPILEFFLRVEGEAGKLAVSRREIRLTLSRPWGEWPAGEHCLGAADVPSQAAYNFSPEYGGEGYYAESARFLKCCAERRPYEVDFAAGMRTERVLDAIYRSSDHDGAWIVMTI
ncbi:MAG: Gfo/Idh/MocA family oxidoreductase [Candidatus Sumerlaeota bacterium]|nr:Gfo/Idh/MocA family oxidoreductase [Candidatus Sumerlaeota bacterium]